MITETQNRNKVLQIEDKSFYVYIYFDPNKQGIYKYEQYKFDYEPFYVGKGKCERKLDHLIEAEKIGKAINKHDNRHKIYKIQQIIKSNKKPIIEIIKDTLTETDAYIFEKHLIQTIGRMDLGTGCLVNLTNGGEGKGCALCSDETRKKLSKAQTGKKATEITKLKMRQSAKGRIVPDEVKQKRRLSNIGKRRSEETKRRISESKKGEIRSEEFKKKVGDFFRGKPKTAEHNKKNSEAIKEWHKRPEVKQKLSESQKKSWIKRRENNKICQLSV